MALVRKAISAKLDSDPSFHLEIHQDQLIHIKAVHPHVNDEGKKRLADFTVECSDPDFVLIMENLALKKVLNIMAVCNPTATLELKMDIGISKNQIGCAEPFSACYVKCNGAGRRKDQPRYIPYYQDATKTVSNTNVPILPQTTSALQIKQEKQPQQQVVAVSKRKGRPAKPPIIIKEEIIKPIEVITPPPKSLKSFFDQIQVDPQEQNNTNNTNETNTNTAYNIVAEQVGADVDPVESPSQIGSALPVQSAENPTNSGTDEAIDYTTMEETNASAPDPGNNDASFVDQTTKDNNEQNRPEISENISGKDDNMPQEFALAINGMEKSLMDQIPEMDLATEVELTQYSTDNTNLDDKNNTTDDSLLNHDEMAEIFKEIFPEYYADTNDKSNNEFNEINSMLFNNDDPSANTMPMEIEPPVDNSIANQDPIQGLLPLETPVEELSIVPKEAAHNMEVTGEVHSSGVEAAVQIEVTATNKMEDVAVDASVSEPVPIQENTVTEEMVVEKTSESVSAVVQDSASEQVVPSVQSDPIGQTETQPNVEVTVASNEVTRVTESVAPELPQNRVAVSNDNVEPKITINTEVPEGNQPALDENVAPQTNQDTEQSAALHQQANESEQEQRQDVEQESENEQSAAASQLGAPNGDNSDAAILVAGEDLDLNEIVYDGEIAVASDGENDTAQPPAAPFIDFFCEESLADDEHEDSANNTNVYNNNEDHHMSDEGPQVTRKRKRGFSLESVVFRSVRPKVEHVAAKQEPGTTPEKESPQNISKDSQVSPIMRAIFTSKMRKNKATSSNEANNNNSKITKRRVTRSTANDSTIEITAKKGKNNNNKRRASSHHEPTLKKENPVDDSPRILIYNERPRRRALPKKEKQETKPKTDTKLTSPKNVSEENSDKISYEDDSSMSSDEDSVEYHVDKLSEDEYFVEEIVDKKVEKGKAQYLIKWLGWPHSDNTWTPVEDISPDIIEVYESSPKQRKPGDRNVLVYNLFWKYAFRRHVRYVKEHPEDPNYENCKEIDVSDGLLDKFSMCNCYRELDSGSIYFKKQVARMKREEDEDDTTKQNIWMAFCYRLVNRLATFEGFGRIPTSRQWPQFKKYLTKLRESGDSVFTSKHNVIGLENYFGVMDNLTAKIDILHGKFDRRKTSLQQCIEYAQTVPFIGPFFAQQICNDLVEGGIINSSNSWVCLGPGAKAGLRNIYPGIKSSEMLDKAKQLQKNQRKAFASLGFDFPFYEGRDLSLIDIEHVLCEFQKYLRMLGKTSSKRHRRSKDKKEKKRHKINKLA